MKLRTAAVVATTALTLSLSACGGGDDSSAGSDSAKDSAKDTPSSSFDVDPATGPSISGDGYELHAPKGWSDVTAQVKKSQARVDAAFSSSTATSGFRPNVNVIVIDNAYSGSASDSVLSSNAKQVVDQLESGGAKNVSAEPNVRVAGDPALHVTATLTAGGTSYDTDQYFIFHDGDGYAVTFSTPPSFSEKQRDAVSDPSLASWAWS